MLARACTLLGLKRPVCELTPLPPCPCPLLVVLRCRRSRYWCSHRSRRCVESMRTAFPRCDSQCCSGVCPCFTSSLCRHAVNLLCGELMQTLTQVGVIVVLKCMPLLWLHARLESALAYCDPKLKHPYSAPSPCSDQARCWPQVARRPRGRELNASRQLSPFRDVLKRAE